MALAAFSDNFSRCSSIRSWNAFLRTTAAFDDLLESPPLLLQNLVLAARLRLQSCAKIASASPRASRMRLPLAGGLGIDDHLGLRRLGDRFELGALLLLNS